MRIIDCSSDVCSSDLIVLLFGPKVLSVLWLLIDDSRRKALGGLDGILNSIAIEIPLSILVAPLNMLTQTMAIIDIIRGRPSGWSTQRREADGTRSEEHTSELQSLMRISYAVFCLKKKKNV